MDFSRSIRFAGNLVKAFEMATTVLTANNFRLVSKSAECLEFTGPGAVSKRHNPISGATRVRITGTRGELALEAELGGVRRMALFLFLFPLGMALFFLILFGTLFYFVAAFKNMGLLMIAVLSIAPLLPWVVLSPLLARVIKRRVITSLETLLENMEIAGRSS